jgi:hypothetical protein
LERRLSTARDDDAMKYLLTANRQPDEISLSSRLATMVSDAK